ncbi:MAG: glycosyltransferase family 2 protein [Elusimicrobiota bacterium]
MKISVIIPVYNEAATIAKTIRRVTDANPALDMEILVVNDGSSDATQEAVEALGEPRVVLLRHQVNQGKGAAIRAALAKARGEVVIIQDADLEYDPAEYSRLLEPILSGRTKVVYGSRILGRNNPKAGWSYYLGGRLLSFVTNWLYGTAITDEPTGYKVFKTEVLRGMNLECRGFEFCPEVTAKAALGGHRIIEVPISYHPRSIKEGKKIKWRDGLAALWVLLKNRISVRSGA